MLATMARVQAVKCDQCHKEEKDPGRTWVHLSASCSLAHARDHMFSHSGSGSAVVKIAGAFEAQFVEKDFCSPECAGNHLFGISNTHARSRSSAG